MKVGAAGAATMASSLLTRLPAHSVAAMNSPTGRHPRTQVAELMGSGGQVGSRARATLTHTQLSTELVAMPMPATVIG